MTRLPAEWEEQEYIMVVFPKKTSDWHHSIKEIKKSYVDFITTLSRFQKCIVICDNKKRVASFFTKIQNIEFLEIETNDTWIRDFGAISVYKSGKLHKYNFRFNAWGEKFDYTLDNSLNQRLLDIGFFDYLENIDFILEGGSIDSNGNGVMLTTSRCIFNPNRNKNFSKKQIETKLKQLFGLKKLIILNHGKLLGDDTDAHIDTLARFINKDTIVYTKCYDKNDEHFEELQKMEKELLKTGYKLIPLPLPKPKIWEGERLPATYINFVFVNNAVLVPIYNDENDIKVLKKFKKICPNLDIIGIDSSVFIRERGSLHCASINFYTEVLQK